MIRLALLLAVVPALAHAQLVFPGGTINSNTTWSVAQSPVTLNGDVTIAPGVTLTIQQGVTVQAAATDAVMRAGGSNQVDIFVDGALQISGVSGFPVTFTGPSTSSSTWGGFIVSATGSISADRAVFQRMTRGLATNAAPVTLNNVTFSTTSGCLSVSGSASVVNVTNSTFAGCGSTAVSASAGTVSLIGSSIYNTTGTAVSVSGTASVTVDRSTLSYNSGYGVEGVCSGTGSVTVSNSIISHNASYGLRRSSCSPSTAVTASNNDVWGNLGTSTSLPTTNANLSSSNYDNVSGGGGSVSANPLFLDGPGRNLRLTHRSPARRPASTDLGALPFTGDNTPGAALQGFIWANETLSGPIAVSGDVTVPSGVTVTVSAGTTFTFTTTDTVGSGNSAAQAEFFVAGSLQAVGTGGSQIAFLGTGASSWGGLRILTGGSASIAQARFDRMTSFEVSGGTLSLFTSTIGNGGCVSVSNSASDVTLDGDTFAGCSSTAVSASAGTVRLNGSRVYNTTGTAVSASGTASVTLDRCTLSYNSGYGVEGVCSGTGSVTVTNSIISHNASYGLRRSSCSPSTAVTASNNDVWGNLGTSTSLPTTNANLSSSNYDNVSGGAGSVSANPLFLDGAGRNLRLTHRSPARRPASTDLGALPFTGDNTPGPALQGFIWANETLSGAVAVSGDVTVPSGVTVTVSAGTTFTFATTDTVGSGNSAAQAEFFVAGSLQANGAPGSQIAFLGTSASSWGGVRVLTGGSASIAQARFDRMTSFEVSGGTLTLSTSTIGNGACVSVSNSASDVTLNGDTFAGCTSTAISASAGTVRLNGSSVSNTTGTAVSASGTAAVTVDRCTLSYNSGYGVEGVCSGTGSVTVTNSIISHNASYGLRRSSCSPSTAVTASYNDVWGNLGTGVMMPPTNASLATSNYDNVSAGTGSQSANPLFTNGTAMPRDLTLTSTSPCIGQGRVGAIPGGMVIDQGAFPFMVGPITTIVVTPQNPSAAAGGTLVFGATAYDSNNNPVSTTFTWSASAAAGTISASGLLTVGCTPGTVTNGVTATAPNGASGRTNVTITLGTPNNIAITPSGATVRSQGTQQYTAAVRDSCNNPIAGAPITWSAPGQAGSISGTGLFTAGCTRGLYGNAISATSAAITGRTDVTVGAGDVMAIGLTPQNPSVQAGMTQLFAATAADGCGNTVMNAPITWSTTAPSSMISNMGIFTAGQTNGTFANSITAATPGGTGTVSASTGVTITGGSGTTVSSISIMPASATLGVGATQQFTATALNAQGQPVAGTTITWTVVNGGGTISPGGLFTAGNTAGAFANTVRASAGAVNATVSITVNPGPIATVSVTPALATLAPMGMTTFTAQVRDAFNNAITTPVTWTALPAAGTITPGGVFSAGSATGTYNGAVTATTQGVSGSATITIQAGALASLTMMPSLAMVQAGGTVGFSVVGRDAAGSVVSVTPVFSVVSGGGTINASTGIFTAGTGAGTFANTVRAEANGLTAFASVQVSPGPVLTVAVTPGSVSLSAGATQQFSAEARDAFNNVIPSAISWSAQPASGTINPGGVFVAGATAGTFSNAITATSNGVNGFATVTVTGGAGGGMAGGAAGGATAGGAAGGSMGGGAAGGSMGGGAAGGSMGGGSMGGGAAGGSMGGGAAGGSMGGGAAGGDAGGSAAGGDAGGNAGGTVADGGMGGGKSVNAKPVGATCGCSAQDGFTPMIALLLLGIVSRRRLSARRSSATGT